MRGDGVSDDSFWGEAEGAVHGGIVAGKVAWGG